MTKSGAARRLGLIIPNPPLLILSLLIKVGIGCRVSFDGRSSSCWKNAVVILSIPVVNGPTQLYHCSKFESLVG